MKSILLRLTLLAGLVTLVLFFPTRALAQPVVITFPSIPCDSTSCDSLILNNSQTDSADIVLLRMRDSTSYAIVPAMALPASIPPNGRLAVPICFTPQRRGTITDSLLVVVRRTNGFDTIRARVTGKGLGASLDARPNVLNFPKTNPGFSNSLRMTISNSGDRPFILTAADLVIPPPFRLITVLPVTINPNDSIELEFAFEPTENGVYSAPIDLIFGCNTRLQLALNGVTDLIGTGAVLRMSKTGFNPANNEQIPCDSTRCTQVTLSNVGNAPLVVDDVSWINGSLGYQITSSIATPFIVPANSQRVVEVCLTSRQRGTLRDTLVVTSNTRSSIAFGIVLDASRSMTLMMKCGQDSSSRHEQAIAQAKNFIGRTLLFLPSIGIQDQLAVITYTSTGFGSNVIINDIFPLVFINDALRTAAQNTLDGITPTGGTPTGAAVKRMIEILKTSPLKNRVMVVLTDGEADASDQILNPLSQLVNQAKAEGIRIFTIGVGLTTPVGRNYLQTLAQGTNGQSYDASDADCSTLQTAFEAITDIVSRGGKTREAFQMKVLSPMIVTVKKMEFDSVYVDGTTCRTIILNNAGEGNAVVDSMRFVDLTGRLTSEFKLAPGVTFPIVIPESGQIELSVCFNPSKIRFREGEAIVYYNSCGSEPSRTSLSGSAFAGANLRVSDQRVGLPGQTVRMPVYADSSLALYSVNTITFKVRWNKTMLDLRTVHPGAQAGGAVVNLASPVSYDGRFATVELTVNGASLQGGGELAQLEFTVLRGDTLSTMVELTEGVFEDNNPRTLLMNPGEIAYDSTCFRSSKPITNGNAAKVVAGEVAPTPARDQQLTLPLVADGLTTVTLEVYATDGSLVLPSSEHQLIPGANALTLDLGNAGAGSYYAVVRTAGGETLFRKILIAR